jgi:CO/xanthine dehydrogenase Mo-binding subunit
MSATTIGQARRRRDGEPKVRGATRYTGDMPVHGLLHGRLVLSAEAHARLTSVDGSAALELPGVVAVLTSADLPLVDGAAGRAGTPLAREEILWSGQPVALVVAESEAAAQDGADLVDVETEPLEAVLDLEAAMADDAPAARLTEIAEGGEEAGAHGGAAGSDDAAAPASPNVAVRQRMHSGDAGAGSTAPMSWSRAASAPTGSTRATWRRRSRSPGRSPTAGWRSRPGRRACSTRANPWPRCSGCRWIACACARRRSAARSAAS